METEAGKGRILVVEDEGLIAFDLQYRLNAFGYEVVAVCATGEEAVQFLEGVLVDLVLLDIRLAGKMDGIDVGAVIRARWNLPVVFLTAFSDGDRVRKAAKTDPAGYLVKPIRNRELFAAVEVGMHRGRTSRRLRESEEWMATTAGTGILGNLGFGNNGEVRFADARIAAVLQRPREELLGMSLGDIFRFANTASASGAIQPLFAAAANGETSRYGTGFLLPPGTDQVAVSFSMTPLLDSTWKVLGMILTVRTPHDPAGERRERPGLPAPPMSEAGITNVAHVSRDPLLRRGLADILQKSSRARVVIEYRSVEEVDAEALQKQADVLAIDDDLVLGGSEEMLSRVDAFAGTVPVIVVASRHDVPGLVPALRRGYSCFVTGAEPAGALAGVLSDVAGGQYYLSPALAPLLMMDLRSGGARQSVGQLSVQEQKVLEGIRMGKQIKEIANDLGVNPKTVSTYRLRLLKKLRLSNNAELIRYGSATEEKGP